jgi:hypothetical protein
MRKFTIYKSANQTKIYAEQPTSGEHKDLVINTNNGILSLIERLEERGHIFDPVFYLDGEQYNTDQLKKEKIEGDPTVTFSSHKDLLTLSKFAAM